MTEKLSQAQLHTATDSIEIPMEMWRDISCLAFDVDRLEHRTYSPYTKSKVRMYLLGILHSLIANINDEADPF